MTSNWERRWHPLLEQWTLISARSALRPWSGTILKNDVIESKTHDPDCYLCPRVTRANGKQNPDYHGPFAFDNDFPSLSLDAPETVSGGQDSLRRAASARGVCRVLCWSENHADTLAKLSADQMTKVAELWQSEYRTLSRHPHINNVLLFENKGTEIGVSNLHPHGQIYASEFITDFALRLRRSQNDFASNNNGAQLLQSLIAREEYQSELLIERGDAFVTIVPYAARFAFETWIVPRRHVQSLTDLTDTELAELAMMYQRQTRRYNLLFEREAPNITVLHNAPCDDSAENASWCFHIDMMPPLRDASKLKYLAGFESGSHNIVNPVQPEEAAKALRACSDKLTAPGEAT